MYHIADAMGCLYIPPAIWYIYFGIRYIMIQRGYPACSIYQLYDTYTRVPTVCYVPGAADIASSQLPGNISSLKYTRKCFKAAHIYVCVCVCHTGDTAVLLCMIHDYDAHELRCVQHLHQQIVVNTLLSHCSIALGHHYH